MEKRGLSEMEKNRLALIGIIVEDLTKTNALNDILHEYGSYVVGRMGIPYKTRGVSLISVIIDAPTNVINSLSGKLGMLEGINVKTSYTKSKE